MDLSRPFGDSINDFIDRESYPVTLFKFDDAVRLEVKAGKGAAMAKQDMEHAFRLIAIRRED